MVILLTGAIAIGLLSYVFTGSVIPKRPADALIFQNALLLIVLGSALLEHKFTKPVDSLVNSLMGMITLVSVYGAAPSVPWWTVFGYCSLVLLLSTVCTAVSSGPYVTGWRAVLARITYGPAVLFGKARLLYSIVFLFGVFSFYGTATSQTLTLLLFWGLFLAIWPLGIPELLSGIHIRSSAHQAVGKVVRTDWPNLVRVALASGAGWKQSSPKLYQQPDGNQCLVVPLYTQVQEEQLLGTGLCVSSNGERTSGLESGFIYEVDSKDDTGESVVRQLGGSEKSRLIGFVVEDSTIPQIRFETWAPELCREGMLVSCSVGKQRVFYQVTGGFTREESLESDRHGFQVAISVQLGVPDSQKGFAKHSWLPPMNTPVFAEPETFGGDMTTVDGDFVYGRIPGTEFQVRGPFVKFMDHHTAILGVTGSGKTELAFDLIRHALSQGVKVVCIDLTARYTDRLKDIPHSNLSISDELSIQLSEKLFEAETGPYGAGNEKKALKQFADRLRGDIEKRLEDFLKSKDDAAKLGIITLDEISNTKATLYITELYLTCLLHFARDNSSVCPRVLIVVEEAHTVMPEPSTMGLGDHDSRGLVSKISQIALQGRKYGVGLLVVAQRTATVSKSVLTQCNTIITLSCFDETSISFLGNFYGEAHTKLVPTLPRLHAIVFGKGVRSERPVIIEIPFDPAKSEGTT